MTPLVDGGTAITITVLFGLIGIIMISQAQAKQHHRAGWIITGFAAFVVSIVYSLPVVFHVPVVEAREALRTALIVYSGNYIILHADVLRALIRRIKSWKFHRS